MILSLWLRALAWAGMVYAIIVGAAVLIYKLVQLSLPHQEVWFWAGLGAMVAASIVYSYLQRPNRRQAAVAIDDRLALKEKFSTALFARTSTDPFAMAAVRDAEQTASGVNLQRKFPVRLPLASIGTVAAALCVALIALFLPTFDFLGIHSQQLAKSQEVQQSQQQARDAVRRAILAIDAAPKAVAENPEIKMARQQLETMRGQKTLDPERAQSTGQKAIEQVQQAIKQKIQDNKDFSISQEEMREFKNMAPPADEPGPIADAHRNLAQGKFDAAVQDLSKAVDNFSKMDKKDQDKAAKQMDQLAKAIKQMANDPKVQQNVKQQLQQMGASQQQQQQMQNLMQQAAAGSPQANQQLQQMAKQLAQQANQSGKSTQQQRQMAQQIQKQMQQMQQQVNAQVNAQQLAGSAQALAAVMKQSAQGGNPGQPKQGQNGAMANKGQQQQPGQQPGKQGQQGGQKQQQQMAQAAKQMQQQMQQMQAVANDAQQVAAGQQNGAAGDNGQGDGQNGKNGQNGQNGNQQANANGNGQQPWGQPQPGQGNGPNMGGVGAGNNRPNPAVAPFSTKDQTDIQQKDEKGKVLASNFVKAGSLKGDAKMQLHDVLPPTDKEAAEEVGEQRIPRQDQDVVRGYFGNLEKDTQKQ
jgi:hypothetical protein